MYLPIDEEHPLEMILGYGVTKHTVEHYLTIYKALYGIEYVVLRCDNVYGSRQDSSGEVGVISIFSEKLLKDEQPYIYGDGKNTIDFVYVKGVARANLTAMKSEKSIKPIYAQERKCDIKHSYMSYDKINTDLGWKPEYKIVDGLKETLSYYSLTK